MHQNLLLVAKAEAYYISINFGRNVGEKEWHLLRYLPDAGAFVHCANWLVKLTPCVTDFFCTLHNYGL
jgi:hypothetical protein